MENKEFVGENCVVYLLTILCTKLAVDFPSNFRFY